ncbi:MAG: hypothetical protein PVJ73_16895 [Acidobacteriota bacterium]|jgi:hypothetical protein
MRWSQLRNGTTLAILLAGAWLAPAVAAAEGQPWLGFGIGWGGFSQAAGVAGHVDAGWVLGRTFVSARLAGVADELACIFCESKGDRVDVALLLGRQWPRGSELGSIAAGVGYVRGQHLAGSTLGLALETRLMARLGRGFGFGLYGFANINSKDTFFGVTLAVRFGGL